MNDALDRLLARLKRPLLYVMGVLYVVAGVMHFVVPDVYAQIVPPVLPAPLALVYLSGVAEIGLGIGVMIPRTRRVAAWGLVALLVAIFPANLYMATSDVVLVGAPAAIRDPSAFGRWARLPFQAVLILWAWWYTRPMPDSRD
ncbi:DoxX family protein [Haloarchaeobius sp. DYHT-AS-18]|uniref:DoxX family protein n=1 Tax=Haloarchaeobius sp. DYHT-AS-18 TaxID=3446117 RepID=UPI003EBC2FE4